MGDGQSSSNTAIVVIFLIAVLAAGVAFFMYQQGYLGGSGQKDINIKVEAPKVEVPQ